MPPADEATAPPCGRAGPVSHQIRPPKPTAATIAKVYKVYYAKVGTGAEYSMDHTAVIYLMDPTGRFASPLTHGMAPDRIAAEISQAQAAS